MSTETIDEASTLINARVSLTSMQERLRRADIEYCMQLHAEYYRTLGRVLLNTNLGTHDLSTITKGRQVAFATLSQLNEGN